MDHLERLVQGMSREQVRFFKLFAGRTNQQHDRKDLRLFNHLRKNGSKDPDKLAAKLYEGQGNGAWYRLRNRLMGEVNKSLTILHYEEDDFVLACHMLGLYQFFSVRNRPEEARYYLRKAERSAASIENFELLDLIYGEYIKLSGEIISINPEEYVRKRQQNREQQEALRTIDDLLAVVTYKLKTAQNFSTRKNPLLDLLKKTTDDFIKDRDLKNSPMLRFRIYHAVTQVLLQRHEYTSLEDYLLKSYKEFTTDKLFNKSNHDTHLQMLTYIVNTLFKNHKIKQSLQWATRLHKAMELYNNLLYDKYFFFYNNALVINYSIADRNKALDILEQLRNDERFRKNSFYHLFVYLNLAVLRFDNGEFKEAIRHLTRIHLLDGYRNADPSLKLKINICEIIVHFELEQMDVIEYKIQQIRKDYKDILSDSNTADHEMLDILQKLPDALPLRKHATLKERIIRFCKEQEELKADESQIINYINWLNKLLSQ